MRNRLILAIVAIAVIACVALGTLAILQQRPGITKANFERVEMGMTLEEVEDLFGTFSNHGATYDIGGNRIGHYSWGNMNHGRSDIWFHNNAVSKKEWTDAPPQEQVGFFERLRRILPGGNRDL